MKHISSSPPLLHEIDFDLVFIAAFSCFVPDIISALQDLGVDKSSIITRYSHIPEYARLNFIQTTSQLQKDKKGSIAELGVWKGDTSSFISKAYPEENFYLLDTFNGFDPRDCTIEKQTNLSKADCDDFSDTSIELVKTKIHNPQRAFFVKGFFPETASQIPESETFKFVNLDVDLYNPILEGLEFFYPRLVKNGIILVHDYFHPYYLGTKKAVDEFSKDYSLQFDSIGDGFSIFIKK